MYQDWFLDSSELSGLHYAHLYAHRLPPERTEREVQALLRLLHPHPQARFLDIPCGTGRHSISLGIRGYNATGVDIHPDLITEAKRQSEAYQLSTTHFVLGDMRTWCEPNTYDFVLSLYTGFGYFETDIEDDQTIQNLADSLQSGGTLIVEYINASKIYTEHKNSPLIKTEVLDVVTTLISTSRISPDNRHFMVTHECNGEKRSFKLRLYSHDELAFKIAKAGLEVTATYGDYSLTPWDIHSPRIILIANKLKA